MNTLRTKAIVLSIVFSMCVLAMPLARVKADSFPSTFYVNNNTFYDAAAIFGAYVQLNSEQKEIAAYLLGMYNLFYLGARGFQFQAGAYTNESEFIAKIKSFGYRLFEGSDGTALRSRFDDNFCKYASAVLLYASQCNVTFSTWFENLDEDFIIPVDQGIINSFTLMYNDNSNEGIASFGDIINPWESGNIFQLQMNDWTWLPETQTAYNNFLYSYSPVLYSDVFYYRSTPYQDVFGDFSIIPNSLFVLRGNTYNSFRFGYTTAPNSYRLLTSSDTYKRLELYMNSNYVHNFAVSNMSFINNIVTSPTPYTDLSDFIYYAFDYSPINLNVSYVDYGYFYPFINHVYMVDDLNSLTNCTEIYNNDSWDVIGLSNYLVTPIDTVGIKPKVITELNLPDNRTNPVQIQDIIDIDNTVDIDTGEPVDPWQINVIVQPNETNPISIDVNLFTSGKVYLEYLWEHTKKIAQFTKDILDCFEFDAGDGSTYGPKYAIYGVLVLGMAGGMIAKFLL